MARSGVRTLRWVILTAAILCIAYAGTYAVFQLGAAGKVACGTEPPYPTTVEEMSPDTSVVKTFSWWPIGRQCAWTDGVHTESNVAGDFAHTIGAYGVVAVGAAGIAWFARSRRRPGY